MTSYNNFYEFGTDKSDPADNAGTLKTRPWTVACEGEIKKPETIDIDKLIKLFPLEERVYRFRCVEAWSMVIPWVGFPLASLLRAAGADLQGQVRRLHHVARSASRCPGRTATCSTGPTSKACASTRRCTR